MITIEPLGRFGHHPDPAVDFCVEVEELEAINYDRKHGIANPGTDTLFHRANAAMDFRVGGDQNAVAAKEKLRAVWADLNGWKYGSK